MRKILGAAGLAALALALSACASSTSSSSGTPATTAPAAGGSSAAADPVNLAGLADEQLAVLRSRGTPQPFGTVTQPLERPDPRPAVPACVIATTFTPEQGRALAESGNPVFAEMTGIELHHLPTGHWPMFSRPAELADLLARLAGPEHAQ